MFRCRYAVFYDHASATKPWVVVCQMAAFFRWFWSTYHTLALGTREEALGYATRWGNDEKPATKKKKKADRDRMAQDSEWF